ncbi:MAG: hypothetical protein C5B54_12255, partial [Acidobacteria bacterium]
MPKNGNKKVRTGSQEKSNRFIVPILILIVAIVAFVFWRKFHHVSLSAFIQESANQKYNVLLIT